MCSQTTAVVGNILKQTNLHMRSQKINWEETHDKFAFTSELIILMSTTAAGLQSKCAIQFLVPAAMFPEL